MAYTQTRWRLRGWRKWKLAKIRSSARERFLEFNLTLDDITEPTHCPILGIELNYKTAGNNDPAAPSVERIDNNKGYIKGNVLICSRRANSLKKDATLAEMEKLYRFYEALKGEPHG